MAFHKSAWCAVVLAALWVAGSASLAQMDPSPPTSPVKLVFLHHSTGENWLRDAQQGDDTAGGLGTALAQNNYFVSDTNYGWGPDGIGDRTDIGNWWEWFRGPDSATITAAVYAESGQNCSYTRLAADPGGENVVVVFKSCFPNSNLGGSPSDPVPPIGENPLRGQDSGSEHHTIANAKGIYLDLLAYFATRPDRLFVIICAPPLQAADTGPEQAANARALNDWLVEHLLDGYTGHNVAVFDFYTVLTSNAGSPTVNDLGAATGNHHRWRNGQIEHVRGLANDFSSYPSGDSHPTAAGGIKASGEFPALLNIAYHCWKGTGGCPNSASCTVSCSATAPGWAQPGTPVALQGNATPSSQCTGSVTYDWDFGDGSAHSSQQNPSHTYAQEGTYSWTFTASSGTATCSKGGTIVISATPNCTLTCRVETYWEGTDLSVLFNAFVTFTSCTGTPTVDWDFGDGTSHSSEEWPLHYYATPGTYTYTFAVSVNGTTCTQTGTVRVAAPPVIAGVQKLGSPFRVQIMGSNFQEGLWVVIGSDTTPWSSTQRKGDTRILLKGGSALKSRFPQGQSVPIAVYNPDGGLARTSYTRP